ncbi:MAG: alpha-glucosidase/alpha-galactosidase [Alphaproteobacteria bacterium]
MKQAKIAFIGAGSTIFMKNIIGDILHKPALKNAHFAMMDINETRLEESRFVVEKLIYSIDAPATVSCHLNDQKAALKDADFVVVAFQIGGFEPCTVTDFEICNKYGLQQTIADTLGVGGIMRAIRTIPHLWKICEDMRAVCPNATMLNYVNPMAMNTWAMYAKYPDIKQVGLCHSVQGTAKELANDLDIDYADLCYRSAGINHMAFYLNFEKRTEDGSYVNLYPDLLKAYTDGKAPKHNDHNPRCQNIVRYEMFKYLGYFVTESSEHFAEYTPYFIKPNRPDIIAKYQVPLDEYPKRCVEQIAGWKHQLEEFKASDKISFEESHEYASTIINSIWTGAPSVIYGNVRNDGLITNLPDGCCVEVPCLVDDNGIQPTAIGEIPTHLAALMRTNINVQELTVEAMLNEDKQQIYYAALVDPHTAASLDIADIYPLVDELLAAHKGWLPSWLEQ